MSKGDSDKDETPIQFYIPRISSRGRAPIPINQPNWKYASDYTTPPAVGDWIFSTVFTIMGLVVIYLAITELNDAYIWLFLALGLFLLYSAALMTVIRLWKYRRYKDNLPDKDVNEKPERKHPKRRKDYR